MKIIKNPLFGSGTKNQVSSGINSVSATDFGDFEQFETPYKSVLSLNHDEIISIYNHVKNAINIADTLNIKFDFLFLESLKSWDIVTRVFFFYVFNRIFTSNLRWKCYTTKA